MSGASLSDGQRNTVRMAFLDRYRKFADPKPPAPENQPNANATGKTKPKRDLAKPVGRTGTVNMRGFLQDRDTNWALRWPQNLDVYEEMCLTDSSIRWMVGLQTLPVRAAFDPEHAHVEPASDDEQDREIAAFVANVLFNELEDWNNVVRQAFDGSLKCGHFLFEERAAFRDVEFTYERPRDREEVAAPGATPEQAEIRRQAFVWTQWQPRLPRTIQRWNTAADDSSVLESVEQWLGDGKQPSNPVIPADRLVVFTHEQEGDDFRGTSILRSAWLHWQSRTQLENLQAIACERSVGIPIAYPPDDADSTELDAVEDVLTGIRQGENVYILAPGPKQTDQNRDGWLIESLNVEGDGGSGLIKDAISTRRAAIAENVWADFMKLGQDGTGARAVGDVQQMPYYLALTSLAGWFCGIVNERIKRLVDWNYTTTKYPRLRPGPIQQREIQSVADAITQLMNANAIKGDDDTERWLRDLIGAPPPQPGRQADQPPELGPDGQPLPPGVKAKDLPEPDDDEGKPVVPPDPKPKDGPSEANPVKGRKEQMSDWHGMRRLNGPERSVAWTSIGDTLDQAQDDLVEQASMAAEGAVGKALEAAGSAVDINSPEVIQNVVVDPAAIRDAVRGVLTHTYERGRTEVRAELRRQRGSTTAYRALETPGSYVRPTIDARLKLLAAKAATVAETVAMAATRAIRQWALRRLEAPGTMPDGPGFDPRAAVRGEARKAAVGTVAAAFADGRADEMDTQADTIEYSLLSSVLDSNSCEFCSEMDGTHGPPGGLPTLSTPLAGCAGGPACRCVWVPVVKQVEAPAAVGESRVAA